MFKLRFAEFLNLKQIVIIQNLYAVTYKVWNMEISLNVKYLSCQGRGRKCGQVMHK